tara:strand:- start:267 stop:641 length:375 start_codon:yes stop_codon:yes gene_type:complete
MKYITCNFGEFLVVGLDGSASEAEKQQNLAHNLFDSYTGDDVFAGRINFTGLDQFEKFLIYKEYFALRMGNRDCDEEELLRQSATAAKKILDGQVIQSNFMSHIRQNISFYNTTDVAKNNHLEA